MAIRNVMVSDITGDEIPEGELVEVVIRSHPGLDAPKRLDAANTELAGLATSTDVVTVELKHNGSTKTVSVTLAEFEAVVPKSALKNAQPTRGRRRGFSPGASKAS